MQGMGVGTNDTEESCMQRHDVAYIARETPQRNTPLNLPIHCLQARGQPSDLPPGLHRSVRTTTNSEQRHASRVSTHAAARVRKPSDVTTD